MATGMFTLATTTAASIGEFLVWRGLTGIALGAALPNVSALSAELAPDRWRATVMAVVSAGIPLGLAIAGVMAPGLIGAAGWQGLFYIPGTFAIVLAGILYLMLEGGPPASAAPPPQGAATVPQVALFRRPWVIPLRGVRSDARDQCAQPLPAQFLGADRAAAGGLSLSMRRRRSRASCSSPGWASGSSSASGSTDGASRSRWRCCSERWRSASSP